MSILFFFFLKMAPQKKQRATNTKEKNNMFESKIYIQWASNHDYKVFKTF